jgi:hypothetical protein
MRHACTTNGRVNYLSSFYSLHAFDIDRTRTRTSAYMLKRANGHTHIYTLYPRATKDEFIVDQLKMFKSIKVGQYLNWIHA